MFVGIMSVFILCLSSFECPAIRGRAFGNRLSPSKRMPSDSLNLILSHLLTYLLTHLHAAQPLVPFISLRTMNGPYPYTL